LMLSKLQLSRLLRKFKLQLIRILRLKL